MNAQKLLAELRHRESKNLPPQVTLRALVPNHYINKLYHTDRGYINQMGSQYDVKLYALPGSGIRLTFVVGSPRAISNAWGHLLDFFLEHFPLTYGETMGMSFLVPDKLAELLQNSNINSNNLQSIAKRSKTEIRLKNHKLPNSTDRILRISVRSIEDDVSKTFMKAVYLLAQNFQQHITLAYSTFNIYYQPTDRQTEYVQDEDNDETVYAPMEDAIPRKWNNDFLK